MRKSSLSRIVTSPPQPLETSQFHSLLIIPVFVQQLGGQSSSISPNSSNTIMASPSAAKHELTTNTQSSNTASEQIKGFPPNTNKFPDPEISAKILILPHDLRVFLERDFDAKVQTIKNLDYYRILAHFNPKTSSRPTHNKAKLLADFLKDVRPHLDHFLIDSPKPPPPPKGASVDFDPLHRRTTREMLAGAIMSANPKAVILPGSRIDQLLVLFKKHVDPDLILPANTEFIRKPMVMSIEKARQTPIESLRFALQCHAPQIFVHSIAMTRPHLASLYIKFVAEEADTDDLLVEGYHYSVVVDPMETGL
ncbi:uncharacterized protein MELLADRAFT_91305 [Melampsora larici-populina 98AG31]|uniref:Uncharacterized protein n=1 Tax=Melampsora larici-populina (strain 98AG31 / pathotype 3-4-7) TaxID=747676 RepID=F4RYJ8_MELLP|nr:uncharacterized protein MELLADRAFT_91305 [Melampsora larici-populina 98AG31]EGG02484.1 hypothetical protein MELLADRAFT_91305 [Melampsora larici-populina 98AG31]